MRRSLAAAAIVIGLAGCDLVLRWSEDLKLTADSTSLGIGESVQVTATNGKSHGHLSFDLRPEGPGPTLDLITTTADLPPVPENVQQSPFVPCCSTLLVLKEGQQMRFKIQARGSGRELTASATGTRYTLFFGSGVPDDPRPSIVTGGPDAVSARTFLLDDKQGVITAPDSIARLNHARVIVFFRNGPLVGWREIVVIHKPTSAGQR